MPTAAFKIKTYQIRMGYELNVPAGAPTSRACINCNGEGGYLLVIYFSPVGAALAPPTFDAKTKHASINVSIDEMHHWVDVLRNEKPVIASVNAEHPEQNNLITFEEPIGEGEG